jgi:hypothetical protein
VFLQFDSKPLRTQPAREAPSVCIDDDGDVNEFVVPFLATQVDVGFAFCRLSQREGLASVDTRDEAIKALRESHARARPGIERSKTCCAQRAIAVGGSRVGELLVVKTRARLGPSIAQLLGGLGDLCGFLAVQVSRSCFSSK